VSYVYILVGIVLLVLGGDWLVKASIDIALRAKISLMVVGLTVVSFATSAPELLVSLNAALANHVDISFGNVVGSNLANIGLILGLTALLFPLKVGIKAIRVDYWILLSVTLLLFLLLLDGQLGFWDALLLFAGLVAYNILQIRSSRRSHVPDDLEGAKLMKLGWMLFYLIGGVAGLRYGAQFLVEGSVEVASAWGVSDRVIGVSIVSVGTSLPELAASLVAAFKGEQDISLGNLIGSNVFNILAVLGITGLVIELPVESTDLLTYDFPWLLVITLVLLPFIRWLGHGVISRWQGLVLLILYTLYLIGVFLK